MNPIPPLFFMLLLSWSAQAAQWDYDGKDTGQDSWSELSPDYALCNTGSNQSPVSLARAAVRELPPLSFAYQPSLTSYRWDRYTIISSPQSPQLLREGAADYSLREMVVRSPSEHEIGDRFYPMELQFLHEDKAGAKLNLSVFVDFGAENAAFEPLIDALEKIRKTSQRGSLDWSALLPADKSYYAYPGSLTTPPCSEGVRVRVLKSPIQLSFEQAERITAVIGRNSRLTQPILLRTITESQ